MIYGLHPWKYLEKHFREKYYWYANKMKSMLPENQRSWAIKFFMKIKDEESLLYWKTFFANLCNLISFFLIL